MTSNPAVSGPDLDVVAQGTVGDPRLNGGIFLFFVVVTLVIVFRASRST